MSFTDTIKNAWASASDNNVAILAAGVSYYAFLSFVPLLTAAVLGYGLFADPSTVAGHIQAMARAWPPSVANLVSSQLADMVATSEQAKGLALFIALALALFGARNGAGAMMKSVAIAFDAPEKRGFLRANLFAFAMLLAGLVGAGLVAVAIGLTAALDDGGLAVAGKLAGYAILAGAVSLGAALLYRRAPKGLDVEWSHVWPGASLAGIGVVVLTIAFGIYVTNFGSYNATYGALGAVVALLTWLYLVAYLLLFGAEIAAVRMRMPHALTTRREEP